MPGIKNPVTCCDCLRVYKNGALIDTIVDLITSDGLTWIISRLRGASVAAGYIAVGSGSTPPALADHALQSEIARVPLSIPGGEQVDNAITFHADFPPGVGTGEIREVGLFTQATGGIMITRNQKGVYAKDDLDAMSFVLTITIENKGP